MIFRQKGSIHVPLANNPGLALWNNKLGVHL